MVKNAKLTAVILFLPFGYDQFCNLNKKIKINDKILFYGAWDRNRENFE